MTIINFLMNIMKSYSNFSTPKTKKKKYNKIKNNMEQDLSKMQLKHYYDTMKCIEKEYNDEKNMLHYAEHYIENQIDNIFNILSVQSFIENGIVTPKGQNACYLHEMPCLLFINFYELYIKSEQNGCLLSERDLLCILSCFYDLKVKEDVKEHNPPFLIDEMKYIQMQYESLCAMELKYEFFITNQFNIQYDLMSLMRKWYDVVESQEDCLIFFHHMKNEKHIFMGDFVKACLKIVAMINELRIICENDNNYEFLEKINHIENKLKKFIVSNNSLYL